ncbi:uncharacterized protein F5891DRAFT_1192432 [Suillus fuscotomentosus]|uniref:Uncharacterized protein n=1 Tax=Suillus fuscotomentosus TaxID=1912939 RepID=A0AAD4E208_9AGAM|nr:uncharacterized protein F5891DRAFT_1192432 [Suillus fuscotomentosus]KAG1897019.1 hypothetical protein F5891DRAFT_1192432 [Suillus fuscotomentosus]
MRSVILFCLFLYLVAVTQAAPTTNATNTTTNDSLKAPSFTTRTLWTIISSSILTLFACIYSAIHPNIPSPKHREYPSILWRQLGMMIMALIAPELIVAWAMRQYLSADQVTNQFKDSRYPNVPPESELKESVSETENRFLPRDILLAFGRLFVLLAKSVLFVIVSLCHVLCAPVRWVARWIKPGKSESDWEDYTWTQKHSFFVLMGGFMLYKDREPSRTLQPTHILILIRQRCIDVPTLTADRIDDKSKGNAISKGVVVLQVAWFVMQLITRAIYHLEITQLEVGTLAFAVLNFLTYAAWWDKPLNVQCPHPVRWKSTDLNSTVIPEDHIGKIEQDKTHQFKILAPVLRPILELIGFPGIPTSRELQVPTFDGSIKLGNVDRIVLVLAGLLMATIFGGIHGMAWFFAFPTHQERVLWCMSVVAITGTPWFALLTAPLLAALDTPLLIFILLYALCIMLYITARAVLLVLMFTTLRDLPPDAYRAVLWTSLVPHL